MSEQDRFEKEREKTLSELPDHVKNMFGVIGFCPSEFDEDHIVPILIVNPFDVPPKPVRDIYWYNLFGDAKKKKKLAKLAHLVYHYGHDDVENLYSFVEQDEFIPYEEGKERGYDTLPEELAQKVKDGVVLREEEEIRVRGVQEMMEDLPKEPSERKRGRLFRERHEEPLQSMPQKKKVKA